MTALTRGPSEAAVDHRTGFSRPADLRHDAVDDPSRWSLSRNLTSVFSLPPLDVNLLRAFTRMSLMVGSFSRISSGPKPGVRRDFLELLADPVEERVLRVAQVLDDACAASRRSTSRGHVKSTARPVSGERFQLVVVLPAAAGVPPMLGLDSREMLLPWLLRLLSFEIPC